MRLVLLLLLIVLSRSASAQPELVERDVLGGRVTIALPAGLQPMSEELMLTKYSAARKPTEAYADEKAAVSVALSHMDAPLTADQLPQAYDVLRQSMAAAYPGARWNRSEVVERSGPDHIVFDLWVPAQTGETRNIMVFTVLEGRLLSVGFNAASYLAEEWAPVGERIIASVRVNQ